MNNNEKKSLPDVNGREFAETKRTESVNVVSVPHTNAENQNSSNAAQTLANDPALQAISETLRDAGKTVQSSDELVKPSPDSELLRFVTPYGETFICTDNAVWLIPAGKDEKSIIPVCSFLKVDAEILKNVEEGTPAAVRIVFTDSQKVEQECSISVSMGELRTRTNEVIRRLSDSGLDIFYKLSAQGNNAYIANYLNYYPKAMRRRVRGVSRMGWNKDLTAFCYPPGLMIDKNGIGQAGSVVYVGEAAGAPPYAQNETLEDWQKAIAKPAENSSRLVFAISAAVAAVLLPFMPISNSIGFNIYGRSSTGKTTAAKVLCSVFASSMSDEVGNWRGTDNGIESVSAAHNNLPLILDELSQANPEDLQKIVYMLGNGRAKTRQNAHSLTPRKSRKWKNIVFSTGEYTLREYISTSRNAGAEIKEGAGVRLADIPAVSSEPGARGIFDLMPRDSDIEPGRLSEQLSDNSSRFYGTAGLEFVKRLFPYMAGFKSVQAFRESLSNEIQEFVQAHAKNCRDSVVKRVCGYFGAVAAGGELGIKLGVFPWVEGTASYCAALCFSDWLKGFTTEEQKNEEFINQVFDRVRAQPENFAQCVSGADPRPANKTPLFGYLVNDPEEGKLAYCIPDLFKTSLNPLRGAVKPMLKLLDSAGRLVSNDKTKLIYKTASGIPLANGVPPGRYVVLRLDEPRQDTGTNQNNESRGNVS